MKTTPKRTPRRREPSKPARPRKTRPPAKAKQREAPVAPAAEPEVTPPLPDVETPGIEIPTAVPERAFAERAQPPEPERPLPEQRRAIFFDVENSSRADHIARIIDHLAVDRLGHRTEFVAVGNWKVIGHDTARLLAQHGAQLVHSAPSVGVRDWSDLRIAVAAGVWLAVARPGDVVEIVSDDRAFDAVGDVAAGLGIAFRRLSFRGLAGAASPAPAAAEPARDLASSRRRRGRRRGGRRDGAPRAIAPAPLVAHVPSHRAAGNGAEPGAPAPTAHTAPHDEIVAVVRDLMHRAPGRAVTLDSLANALKSRGFSRPPGSPRLITRLRRIREIAVSRSGTITLVEPGEMREPEVPAAPDISVERAVEPAAQDEAPERPEEAGAGTPVPAAPRRRRSRRGGRRRRGRSAGTAPVV